MAKMGRPKKEQAKLKTVGVRMTEEEHSELQSRAAEHDLSITQAVHQGIRLLYDSWEDSAKSRS